MTLSGALNRGRTLYPSRAGELPFLRSGVYIIIKKGWLLNRKNLNFNFQDGLSSFTDIVLYS